MQSKRKIAQIKEVIEFNSDKVVELSNEIKELRVVNAQLMNIDRINQYLLDISIYMKKELFNESTAIFVKVDAELEKLKETDQHTTTTYFHNLVTNKKNEFLYLMKEKMFSIMFDVFVEKYDSQSFSIGENSSKDAFNFQEDTPQFIYYTKCVYAASKKASNPIIKFSTIDIDVFNEKLGNIDGMIDLFFDQGVYNYLANETHNNPNLQPVDDVKFIEIVLSAKKSGLLHVMLEELSRVLGTKIKQLLERYLKFLITIFNDKNLYIKFKYNKEKNDIKDLYMLFGEMSDVEFIDMFIENFFKIIISVWQKVAILLRSDDNKDKNHFNKIFEMFFSALKVFVENVFLPKTLASVVDMDISMLADRIRKKFRVDLDSLVYLMNRTHNHFIKLANKFIEFIQETQREKLVNIHLEGFEDAIIFKIKSRIQQIYDSLIAANINNFDKIEQKIDLVKTEVKHMCSKQRICEDSPYSRTLINRRYTIVIVNNFERFLNDMQLLLNSNLAKNEFAFKNFMYFTNKALFDYAIVLETHIFGTKLYTDSIKHASETYYKTFLKKAKHEIFPELSSISTAKSKLQSFIEDQSYNSSKIVLVKFWTDKDLIEYFERCLIVMNQLYNFSKSFVVHLINIWKYLDVAVLDKISRRLDINLDLLDHKKDLKDVKNAIIKKGVDRDIAKKLTAKVELTMDEHVIMLVHHYFLYRSLALNLLFVLKLNLDYMIYSLFEQSLDALNKLPESEKKFFSTSTQIFEFKNLLTSFDKMSSPYLQNDTITAYFTYNTVELLFSQLHRFILYAKQVFRENRKYVKNYYLEYCNLLCELNLTRLNRELIYNLSKNYKFLKKLIDAESEEDVDEVMVDFGYSEHDTEIELTKASLKR